MKEFTIGKELLKRAMIEIEFAELKGADLQNTKDLIETLLKRREEYLFFIN